MPKVLEAAILESGDPLLDGGRFLLKVLFPRREEKNEFGVGRGADPIVDVVRVAEDVVPYGCLK